MRAAILVTRTGRSAGNTLSVTTLNDADTSRLQQLIRPVLTDGTAVVFTTSGPFTPGG